MTRHQRQRALDKLYAELPKLDCKGECAESCGAIALSREEYRRICDRLGYRPILPPPLLTLFNAATQDYERVTKNATCPMLTPAGRCRVYGVRPMICRLWGLVQGMPCKWGCRPERVLSDAEGRDLLRRANEIGGGVFSGVMM